MAGPHHLPTSPALVLGGGAPTTPTTAAQKLSTHGTQVYLVMSATLSVALCVLSNTAASFGSTDASLGLFCFTPLLTLSHHAFVIIQHLRSRRAAALAAASSSEEDGTSANEARPRTGPLALGPEHKPALRLLAAVYALGAGISFAVLNSLRRELAGSACDMAAWCHCADLAKRVGAVVLQAVLGTAQVAVLVLLLRCVGKRANEGDEEEDVIVFEMGNEYEEEKWALPDPPSRRESRVSRRSVFGCG
jgi:hypothetical protein